MIRKAFHKVQKKQRRLYGGLVALASLAALTAGGYAYYSHRQMMQQQAIAEAIFYDMKALDVEIANLERLLAASGNAQGQDQVKKLSGAPAPDAAQLRAVHLRAQALRPHADARRNS